MSLINIAWGLIILLLLGFGLNFMFNARVDNEKYKFFDSLIGLGMGIATILVIISFFV
ncbi:hypothetical protein ACQKEY_22475 [Lysinibacillus fusiformis]|uniref:hypothetical protein n=1 Tax=Lysinibacillus fusiformis TaxID=28031 RepID=UPI002E1CF37F|nr:hypothetical protein [Lysinibacillus fusiformis]